MKIKKHKGAEQRRILVAMVTDQVVCSRIASQWKPNSDGLFDSKWANLIAGWCVEHVQKYDSPPGSRLRPIFEAWAATTNAPESTIDVVEKFLVDLSDEHVSEKQPASSQHVLDLAGKYFNTVRIKRQIADAEFELDRGKPDAAHR